MTTSKEDKTLKRLARAVEKVYQQPQRMLWLSFASGVVRGVGTAIGATVVVAFVSYVAGKIGVFEDIRVWFESIFAAPHL